MSSVTLIGAQIKKSEARDVKPPEIRGSVIYSDKIEGTNTKAHATGMYSISPEGEFSLLLTKVESNGGGLLLDGLYYSGKKGAGAGGQNVTITKYDPDGWKTIGSKVTLPVNFIATDVAFDLATGKVYGCFMTGQNTFEFGTVDYERQRRTKISDLGARWFAAMGVSPEGILYGVDDKGYLFEINKETGELKNIGFTGFEYKNTSGGDFDPATGKFYCSFNPPDKSGFVCEVDLKTGKATKVHDFKYNDELVGIYIPAPAPLAKAPGKPTSLVSQFDNGALSGKVSFTMPTMFADSTAGSGTVSYIITANGKKIAEKIASYGQKITENVTVDKAGDCRFRVVCLNQTGTGDYEQSKMFVGKDAPEIPTGVTATYLDGKFTVKWNASKNSYNGGYIAPADVRYNVVRMPEGKKVATGVSQTEIIDEVGKPDNFARYYYEVTALYENLESPAGVSAKTPLGNIHAPWKETFDNEDGILGFTLFDADKDKKTFSYFASQKNLRMLASTTKDKDDWVFTPPTYLEKNKSYKFSVEAKCQTDKFTEKVEIKVGKSADVASMNQTVADTTEINSATVVEVGDYFTVNKTGVYYIGVHACSAMKQSSLYLDTFVLDKGKDSNAPAAPTEMTAVPDFNGGDSCKISFKAPLLTSVGDELNRIEKIELKRDTVVIKSFDAPAPGDPLEFTDKGVKLGRHTYSAMAYNNVGAGIPAEVSVMIGVNISAEPMDLTVKEDSKVPGKVKLSWKAPEKDVDGNKMNPAFITYLVSMSEESRTDTVFSGIKETEIEFTPVEPRAQKYLNFHVVAVTSAGNSKPASTGMNAIGTDYTMPYYESFPDTKYGTAIMTEVENGSTWRYYRNGTIRNVNSPDGDNGYANLQGVKEGDNGSMYLGRIDLKNAKNPQLSLRTFNCTGSGIDKNEIEVYVNAGGAWESLGKKTVNEIAGTATGGWYKLSCDLKKYAGKVVRIKLTGRTFNYPNTMFDAISVGEAYDSNIALRRIEAPEAVDPAKSFTINGIFENAGTKDVNGYKIGLYRNGQLVKSYDAPAIGAGKFGSVVFKDSLTPDDGLTHTYLIRADYAADKYDKDNESATASVVLRVKNYPMVGSLAGMEEKGKGIRISWDRPDLSVPGESVTEDFELWDSWKNNVGDWTFIDGDNTPVGGLGGYPTPLGEKTLQSFYVFDFAYWTVNRNKTFKSYSGNKHLANMYCWNDSRVDDWMISPELSGKAQKVSFMIRRYATAYLETFEFLTSTADNPADTASFKVVARVSPEKEWTKYEYNVPAGTKYFAIRCVTQGGMMLFVDDVTYIPGYSNLKLTGYKVYRDGKVIGTVAPNMNVYYDKEAAQAKHRYSVTALYSTGESKAREVFVEGSGVDMYEIGSGFRVISGKGYVDIINPEALAVRIYTLSGMEIRVEKGEENMRVDLPAGIYVVRAGNRSCKVVVE